MNELDKSILETLRNEFMLWAWDLAHYPEGSPEHIRARHAALDTSHTVCKLFGADAAKALSDEAIRRWPRLGQGAEEKHRPVHRGDRRDSR